VIERIVAPTLAPTLAPILAPALVPALASTFAPALAPTVRAALLDHLRRHAFSLATHGSARRIGAEVELIPTDAETGRVCPLEPSEDEVTRATLPFLRAYGGGRGWCEVRTAKGTPSFALPDGGAVTFEPGGQIEYSSAPCDTANDLLARLRGFVVPLRVAAADSGIEFLACGMHPSSAIADIPLQLDAPRYVRMTEYFNALGPYGVRMMRQSAACQVAIELDAPSHGRWRVLNAMAPVLVAAFANSPVYNGAMTGYQSYRAHVWRSLDAGRTGIINAGRDPAEAYLDFALGARAMMHRDHDGVYPSFGAVAASGHATEHAWDEHLSTLFPEVRPRGYAEVRSTDAIGPEHYAALIALIAGVVYDRASLAAADDLVGPPNASLLVEAGVSGVESDALRLRAVGMFDIALRGCTRLGAAYLHPAEIEHASEFVAMYTARGRAPAHDIVRPRGWAAGRTTADLRRRDRHSIAR
jgi:glutamate--cysteine ligase